MSQIPALVEHFPTLPDGLSESRIPGVHLFHETRPTPRSPMVYTPGVCIVVQGSKIGYLGGEQFRYDASNYLVTSVTMPFECETFASPGEPLLGLFIDVDMTILNELISGMDVPGALASSSEKTLPRGIGPARMDEDMTDAIIRLLKALRSDTEAAILGPSIVREILYRILCGTQAPVLYSLAMYNGPFSRIARVLQIIQTNYAEKLDVEHLAARVHMSPSAFHRAFREITSDSPIQYLKKIRLTKARDLMMRERMKAYLAADRVGYESASQFSREFKRYFGQTPAEMSRELRVA